MKRQARSAILLAPGEGRDYPMGRIRAVFKADGAETGHGDSVSECGVFLVFSDFVMKALGHNPGQESWFSTGRD